MSEDLYLIPSDPFPDQMNDDMAGVYDYWLGKCPDKSASQFPDIADLDLMDLYKVADHLLLCDVVRQENQATIYRWRFWGTSLATFFAREMTGKFIHEFYTPEANKDISASYDWVLENKDVHYWERRGGLASNNQRHLLYERLICPVLGPSGNIDHLFGIITFSDSI